MATRMLISAHVLKLPRSIRLSAAPRPLVTLQNDNQIFPDNEQQGGRRKLELDKEALGLVSLCHERGKLFAALGSNTIRPALIFFMIIFDLLYVIVIKKTEQLTFLLQYTIILDHN